MNALWNVNVRPNLRILLLNNGGGEIFHTLPGLDMSGTSHKFIAAVHKTSAKGWAEERGFLYMKVEDGDELAEAMKIFTQPEETKRISSYSLIVVHSLCVDITYFSFI